MKMLHPIRSVGLIGILALSAAAGTVGAKTTNLGTLSDGSYLFSDSLKQGHSFTDYVRFKVDDSSGSFDLSLSNIGLTGISDFSSTLQHLGKGGFQTLGTFSGGSAGFNELLTPGVYRLALSGSASGLASGFGGTLQVAAVPEADTWIMLLVGAGAVLYQLRRKQRSLEQQQSQLV